MSDLNTLFFELIRVAIGTQESLSRLPSEAEWEELFDMAKKQSLIGVCFVAVQRLTGVKDTINHTPYTIHLPETLYLNWMGMAAQINMKNELVNRQCVEVQKRLAAEGFRSSILKGQGIAALYRLHENDNDPSASSGTNENCRQGGSINPKPSTINLSGFRQSGDIDIYVDCGREKAIEYARSVQGDVDWDYKHLHLNVFEDTAVEMHYVPEVFLNLRKNRKLQKWFRENQKMIFNENEDVNENDPSAGSGTSLSGEMVCPSVEFNLFYILLHTYRHFLYEGVGMRQLMDYYFVLRASNSNADSNANLIALLKEFGMTRFASGVMWIMAHVFANENENSNENCRQNGSLNPKPSTLNLPIEPDEKEGRYILSEVMTGGNFGHHDKRLAIGVKGKFGAVMKILRHSIDIGIHYPVDMIWAPINIVHHWCWKRYLMLFKKQRKFK